MTSRFADAPEATEEKGGIQRDAYGDLVMQEMRRNAFGLIPEREDQPQRLADEVYEAICKDIEEKPTPKGVQAFRDKVFESCTPTTIVLRGVRMGQHGVAALLRVIQQSNMQITKIDLSSNNFGDKGASAIAAALPHIPTLQHLVLAGCGITSQGVAALTKNGLSRLLSLDLGSSPSKSGVLAGSKSTAAGFTGQNYMNGTAILTLCRALRTTGISGNDNTLTSTALAASFDGPRTSQLTMLSLRGATFNDEDGQRAIEMLALLLCKYNGTITALNLDDCGLGPKAASVICAAVGQSEVLRYLSMANNNITSAAACQTIGAMLHANTTLVGLKLPNNPIGQGVTYFAEALALNTSLVVLDLTNCGLGDEGAEALAAALAHNKTLTTLALGQNSITEVGAQLLAQALHGDAVLSTLELQENPIKTEGAVALAKVMSTNSSLLHLNLAGCRIGDEGVVRLLGSVAANVATSLRTLILKDNFISANAGEAIVDALQRNQTLTNVDLRGSQIDQVRLARCRAACQRNLTERREAEPRRLRREIQRLREEQVRLRRAETLLANYQTTIADAEARIAKIERERAEFLRQQEQKRKELRQQIEIETKSIEDTEKHIAQCKQNISDVEQKYNEKLNELRRKLDQSVAEKQAVSEELQRARADLEVIALQRPSVLDDLAAQIKQVRAERTKLVQHARTVRQQLKELRQAFEEGKPIPALIEQAKLLLEYNALLEEANKHHIAQQQQQQQQQLQQQQQQQQQQPQSSAQQGQASSSASASNAGPATATASSDK